MKSNFKKDLKFGQEKEAEFARQNRWRQQTSKQKFTGYDLFIPITNQKVLSLELKFERYSAKLTPNFFVETVSNSERNEAGGVFKVGLQATYYAHQFTCGETWVFFTKDFKERVWQILNSNYGQSLEIHKIKNDNYTTLGVCIPRQKFLDLRLTPFKVTEKTQIDTTSELCNATVFVTPEIAKKNA